MNNHDAGGGTPAVNLKGVTKSFGNRTVLEAISFQLSAGESLCICGVNAAGKTTLLRIIAALLQPTRGTVEICGFNVKTQTRKVKPLVGAIMHQSMVYPQLTVIENLRFFAELYGLKNSNARIQQLLEQMRLTPYRYDTPAILSRGINQRLAIARALIHNPDILLADEPFTALDSQAAGDLITILQNFKNRGRTVIMTTHHVDLSLNCCDKVAVLHDRKFIFNAKTSDINISDFAQDYLSYARKIS